MGQCNYYTHCGHCKKLRNWGDENPSKLGHYQCDVQSCSRRNYMSFSLKEVPGGFEVMVYNTTSEFDLDDY